MMDFNPRPRAEGGLAKFAVFRVIGISIHALVQRAAQYERPQAATFSISIHALVQRAAFGAVRST